MVQKVLVLGGYGLIGFSVVQSLIAEGYNVVGLGRDTAKAAVAEPRCLWVKADIAKLTSPLDWLPIIQDVDIVVNASGALQTGLADNLTDLQDRSISALIEACEVSQVGSFIQISAPGALPNATTEFLRTKSAADERLRSSSLKWHILRPGLVISPNAYGGTALLRMLAAFPLVLPLVHADAKVSTVHIDDVTKAISLSINGVIPPGSDVDIAEMEPRTLRDVVLSFRRWLGYPEPAYVVSLPRQVGSLVGKVSDVLGFMGWRSPLRSTAISVMGEGVETNSDEYVRLSGQTPKSLVDTLHCLPNTIQERWFAPIYLLMPIVLATLSLFWLASGLIGLVQLDRASAHMTSAGFGAFVSAFSVIAGAVIDICLGAAVLYRPTARLACLGMVAVTAIYLFSGSFLTPHLWMDPLGPLVKTIPAAVLALVGAVLVRSR